MWCRRNILKITGMYMERENCRMHGQVSQGSFYWMRSHLIDIHGPGGDWRGNKRPQDPTMCGQICGNICLMHQNAKKSKKWAVEKPKLDNARRLRGIYFIELDDEEFKDIMNNARRKLEIPMPAAIPCKTLLCRSSRETWRATGGHKTKNTLALLKLTNQWESESDWDYECHNLCLRRLGALSGKYRWPTSRTLVEQNQMVLGNSQFQRSESNWWRAIGIRGANIPRIHYIEHPRRDSKNMIELQCEPEHGNTQNVRRILLLLRIVLADSRSHVGHFWDLDQKRIGMELVLVNQMENETRLLN